MKSLLGIATIIFVHLNNGSYTQDGVVDI